MRLRLQLMTLILALLSMACGPAPSDSPAATDTAVSQPEAMDEPEESEDPPVPTTLSDDQVANLMFTLTSGTRESAAEAIEQILAADDKRFIAVFIELLRAGQIGLVQHLEFADIVNGLEQLSDQSFGGDWNAWVEWYGGTDLEPPPGFTGWKGELLSIIDPGFGEFLQDDFPSRIRVEEILWGGVRVDGIPALDNPTMITPDEATYLEPWDAVFGIAINEDARAYPLRILDWHEMANDVIGGVPVSLAYCTLCGAAIAYDGRVNNTVYDFGSSGFLFRSNKLMYDRQTRTLWNQLTGEPVLGELVGTGIQLELLPVVLTTWAEWQAQHPDTLVVDIDTGFRRDYTPGAPYGNYFAAQDTMFPVWQRDEALATKNQIYALRIDGTPKAYPLDILAEKQVVNDELAGTNLVLVATRGMVQVSGNNQFIGPVEYEAGSEVRVFDRGQHLFAPGADADTILDAEGNEWQVTETALLGPDGQTASRINGHLAYWFGWYTFFPDTLVYEE